MSTVAKRRAGEGAGQDADEGDADLDRRQEPSGILRQPEGGGGARASAVGHRLQAGLAGRDDGQLGQCEEAVQADQEESYAEFEHGVFRCAWHRSRSRRMWLSHASARNASSDENPQLVEKGADPGNDRGGNRGQDQDAADRREPADDRGHAIPLQDAEREGGDGEGRRNVAERDRQEKDDGEQEAGRADDPLRDGMEQQAKPGPQEPFRPVQDWD